MLRFSYTRYEGKKGTQRIFHIKWTNSEIPYKHYCSIYNRINNKVDYSYPDENKKRTLVWLLTAINDQMNSDVNINQFLSIRDMIMKQRNMDNHRMLKKIIRNAFYDYMQGMNIIAISIKYEISSSKILKEILLLRGYDERAVSKLFNNGADDKLRAYFYEYDMNQFEITWRKDMESTQNQHFVREIAQKNEDIFVDFFKSLGIRCKTQEELVTEQIKEHGRATATPDILFLDIVFINNVEVKWIDFKNYTGIDATYFYSSNKKQAAKYQKIFGNGAVCYNYSFVKGMNIPNTLLLDGSALELNYS